MSSTEFTLAGSSSKFCQGVITHAYELGDHAMYILNYTEDISSYRKWLEVGGVHVSAELPDKFLCRDMH